MKQEQDTVFKKEMEEETQKQQKKNSFQDQKSPQKWKIIVAEIKQKAQ